MAVAASVRDEERVVPGLGDEEPVDSRVLAALDLASDLADLLRPAVERQVHGDLGGHAEATAQQCEEHRVGAVPVRPELGGAGSGPSASVTPGSNGRTSSRVTASPDASIDDTTSTVSARTGEQVA